MKGGLGTEDRDGGDVLGRGHGQPQERGPRLPLSGAHAWMVTGEKERRVGTDTGGLFQSRKQEASLGRKELLEM